MFIGALCLVLQLPDSHSLKDKRQVVRSLLARARNDFAVAAAEVGDTEGNSIDRWQIAELGFACVSNNATHVGEILDAVIRFVEDTRPDLNVLDIQRDISTL
jgi:uncharacterized protein